MQSHEWMSLGLKAICAMFAFAFGACLGSLINVLVYRLPRGMDVVFSPSKCPACENKLTWRENFPVFGWLALGGKCRFCKSKISAEYPLVEFTVGFLWMMLYIIYYAIPDQAVFLGVDWSALRPDWTSYDRFLGAPSATWHIFIVHLMLVGGLVAMTLVDAKTYTIPLVLPWACALIGVVFHTIGAIITQSSAWGRLAGSAPQAAWAMPVPAWPSTSIPLAWWWIGACVGAVAGLVFANLLLHFKLIRRSFEDYMAWEKDALKAQGIDLDAPQPEQKDEGVPVGEHVGPGVRLVLRFVLTWVAVIAIGGVAGAVIGPVVQWPAWSGLAAGFVLGPLIAALACRSLAPVAPVALAGTQGQNAGAQGTLAPVDAPTAPEMWIAYPHARREMMKEVIFLTPCCALALLGGWLFERMFSAGDPQLWLLVLSGTLMGGLIGGGVVWAIRILGSLAFGKEAMGLGDVHLMVGVGACLGWLDAALAVPLAAMVGLFFVIVSILANRPAGKAMPFGPYLAVASLLIMLGKPLVELGLSHLVGAKVHLP